MDLISVIVPVYNVEKYLNECILSLINQTYKDIEVIMIDDGSSDSSGQICEEYAKEYNNFFAFHKKNAGLGMARNTGLEHINGHYVVFLDSDDYLEPNFIEVLYNEMIKNKVDMCKGGFRRITDQKDIKSIRKYKNEVYPKEKAKKILIPRMIGSSPDKHDSIEMCVTGAIYNADIIKAHNLKFPSERELISEDLVFNIDYMQYASGACTIDYIGYNYRINISSLTKSYRSDRFDACKVFYLAMKDKLNKLGYDNNTLYRLQRLFFVYIRMCISQERSNVSSNDRKKSIKIIDKICDDNVVRDCIKKYPVSKLGIKQSLFLNLINKRAAKLLYWLAEKEIL